MISKLTNDIVSTIAEEKPLIYISEEAINLKKDNDKLKQELERLNNIINELEKYLEKIIIDGGTRGSKTFWYRQIYDYLQELKGVDNLKRDNYRLKTEKEQLNSLVNSCQKEIRRLNNIINKTIESLQEHYDNSYSTDDVDDIGSGTYDNLMEILKGANKE